jgi:hypothetical protein
MGMLPFWLSILLLSLVQGGIVALARPPGAQAQALVRLRDRRWALLPPLSVLGFVLVAGLAERASAQALTYLALVAVPLLALAALGWLTRGGRPVLALLAPALFALAWADSGALPGQAAALALSALSCVALGVLLATVTPPRWLAGGIVAMALADAALVVADLLQKPNHALNAAHPAAGLPRLQSALLGSAVMGFGDLFIAGVLGALLARALGARVQARAALLAAVLCASFDLLFFFVDELPATVPVALTLIVVWAVRRRRSASAPPTRAPAAGAPAPAPGSSRRDRPPRRLPRAPAGP